MMIHGYWYMLGFALLVVVGMTVGWLSLPLVGGMLVLLTFFVWEARRPDSIGREVGYTLLYLIYSPRTAIATMVVIALTLWFALSS